VLDERPQFQFRSLNGHRIAGSPLHIAKIFDEYATHGVEIHRIVMANPPENLSCTARAEIERISRERSITIEILPEHLLLARPAKRKVMHADKVLTETAEIAQRPFWKNNRFLNMALAAVTMIPVAAVVAILVLIDVGYPTVFWQQRVGRLGRPLYVYK